MTKEALPTGPGAASGRPQPTPQVHRPQALEELAGLHRPARRPGTILFRVAEGLLYVVAGERRVEAAKKAGLTTIPPSPSKATNAEIAIVENLLRQDLTAVEEAEALQAS